MQPLIISSPGFRLPGQAFAGEGAGVQRRCAFHNHAVNGHLFSGLHHDDAAHFHFIRVYLLQLAISLNISVVRPDIHELADVPAAPAHGVALEPLADLVNSMTAMASV